MRTRTLAREATLQYLYEVDLVGTGEAEPVEEFLERQLGRAQARPFARKLIAGVLERRDEIDRRIADVAEHWTLERMAIVDRNVLRVGAHELLHVDDVPPKVAINEAIDLARRFSTEEACAFVNGILDRIRENEYGETDTDGGEGK